MPVLPSWKPDVFAFPQAHVVKPNNLAFKPKKLITRDRQLGVDVGIIFVLPSCKYTDMGRRFVPETSEKKLHIIEELGNRLVCSIGPSSENHSREMLRLRVGAGDGFRSHHRYLESRTAKSRISRIFFKIRTLATAIPLITKLAQR